eukprot:9569281-Alexandrium_andersonii.AAC.1
MATGGRPCVVDGQRLPRLRHLRRPEGQRLASIAERRTPQQRRQSQRWALSLIHISEPTRLALI